MAKLTQSKFDRLKGSDKTQAYFTNDGNLVDGRGKSRGPSVQSQAQFWNDWVSAFGDFQNRLPTH